MRKIVSCCIAMALFFLMPFSAAATGFYETGYYSRTDPAFGFMPYDSVLIFSKEVDDNPDYGEIYAGSDLYIPVYIVDENNVERIANDKDIKQWDVQVSHKVGVNRQYIDSVTLVDGKKAKISEIPAGIYAKVEFADYYPLTNNNYVEINILLSVDKKVYQDTRVTLRVRLKNWTEEIEYNSVYGVFQPTVFRTKEYSGTVTFDFGDNMVYATKVDKNSRYYINLDKTPDTAVTASSPKTYMQFYNFHGNYDKFPVTGNLRIPIDRAKFKDKQTGKTQVYAYEILGDSLKALTAADLTFDSKKDLLTIYTNSLSSYVLSAQPLLKNLPVNDEDDIIFTGYAQVPSSSSSSASSKK